ncbi:hypothetical protein MACH26_14330 [Planctobacterium marinum]|uniref:Solute-binding protein family 3/N-terminal domain-containing protein n=1 Tax=Planctobacterium marinum TaxID=1631968 RepID=A0AA48KRA4_9ALTE|nr:hypothetical protein MACH26_14330 [Planctobacterium marinum]
MPVIRNLIRLVVASTVLIGNVTKADFLVVMEPSPPFQFFADNQVRGSVASHVQQVFQQAQIHAQFEIFPWTRAVNLAQSQSNVFISGIARTQEREDQFKWIAIVQSFDFALITTNELIYAETLDDARQFTIAVQRNDISHIYLKEMGFSEQKNLFLTTDITESWRLLNKQKVDFLVEDVAVVEDMARDYLTNGQNVTQIVPLPDLHIDAWLAANPAISDEVVARLKQAFSR